MLMLIIIEELLEEKNGYRQELKDIIIEKKEVC
jgi:hypothetical protein